MDVMQGQAMRQKHLQLNKARMSIWDCCELLNECVDDSDPDLEEPQIQHLLQTAEAIRLDHPDHDWFHLVGLIHGWLPLWQASSLHLPSHITLEFDRRCEPCNELIT